MISEGKFAVFGVFSVKVGLGDWGEVVLMVGVGRGGGIEIVVSVAEGMLTVELKRPRCQLDDTQARSDGNAYDRQ